MNRSPLYLFSFLCLFCLHSEAFAAVRLAGVFTNHMVLQRDREVPVWGWADARIDGNRVILSHPAIAKPIAARYGYSNNLVLADLYNKDGLPASPFRSDDW